MRATRWALALTVALACRGGAAMTEADATKVATAIPREKLQRLAGKRIYFGHQSVGVNIAEGLEALGKGAPELRVVQYDAREPGAFSGPGIGHVPIGKNEDPGSKIQAFGEAFDRGGLGGKVDVALFKFCYVDFAPGRDVAPLFAEYRATLARLKQAHPGVTFVHVTSPLTVVQGGPKAFVKRLLGRKLGGVEANVNRERFNALLRAEYAGREPIFDLARVESTRADGTAETFEDGGQRHPALAPEYAADGRHLNALGSRWAAAHLLRTLADAVP